MGKDRRSEEQKMDTFLDALTKRLAERAPHLILTPSVMADIVSTARRDMEAPEEWSTWLTHDGMGDEPLPPATPCNAHEEGFDYYDIPAGHIPWHRIARYRYRCEPGGWIKRGDWVPPDWLWDEKSPVRCELAINGSRVDHGPYDAGNWENITHIRLLPRAAKTEMPEGWEVDSRGDLLMPNGRCAFVHFHAMMYPLADIRAAVEAWLDEMQRRAGA